MLPRQMYTKHDLDIKRFITIEDTTIGFDMMGAICGSEISLIKITSFYSKDKDRCLF